MEMCVVIRSNQYYKKLNLLQRIFARVRPKRLFLIRRIELTIGCNLNVLVIPESIGIRRSAKILKSINAIKLFDTVLLDPAFWGLEKLFLNKANIIIIPDVGYNGQAQNILNIAMIEKLFEKSVATLCCKNELSIGISIDEEWQFSDELLKSIASKAKYVTILSPLKSEFFVEKVETLEQEYGLECFISQDFSNGLLDCDVVISFGLTQKTRLKRNAVIIDVFNSFENSRLRKVVNGFEVQPLISWDIDKEGAELLTLVRKNIGMKLVLLFFLVDNADVFGLKFTTDYLNHFWIQSLNKFEIMRNDRLLKQINKGFAQLGLYINTICHKGY